MVVFSGLTLPHVTQIQQQKTRTFYQVTIPNRVFDYRVDLGAQGDTITVDGWLQSADAVMKAQISALGGTVGILDLQEPFYQPFDQVWYYQTTPAWTNDTAEAQSGGGTAFTVLAATTDYMYFGSYQRWNLMNFIFGTLGSYGTLTWQYSQGAGVYAALTVTDGTSGFTKNGAITFTPPSAWAIDTVNSIANMFWLRVSAASVTTVAKALQILLNPCYQCLLINPKFTLDPTVWDYTTYEAIFQQVENPPA